SAQLTATSPTLHNAEQLSEDTPIYLFIHLPTTISELLSWLEGTCYFWSFDETGQSQMSAEECERWRLPVLTFNTDYLWLYSWPTHIYTALRDWQMVRGFDPTTSDWARSMGYPEWDIVGARKVQGQSMLATLIPALTGSEEKKAGSSWWEAIVGSGISAFGI
ncbi:hypothetical protein MPER_03356, partial [Moniliophthora perniciosa FA553]